MKRILFAAGAARHPVNAVRGCPPVAITTVAEGGVRMGCAALSGLTAQTEHRAGPGDMILAPLIWLDAGTGSAAEVIVPARGAGQTAMDRFGH
ncbi:hypothetical protein [Sagittula sp. S175]|uniref:hypothetical protein n=1 Tax=Sagittula sp. S175 TaxID=3415129 RepID=UPI003C7CADA0